MTGRGVAALDRLVTEQPPANAWDEDGAVELARRLLDDLNGDEWKLLSQLLARRSRQWREDLFAVVDPGPLRPDVLGFLLASLPGDENLHAMENLRVYLNRLPPPWSVDALLHDELVQTAATSSGYARRFLTDVVSRLQPSSPRRSGNGGPTVH